MSAEPPLIAGRYRLGPVLGRGGMSTVHEAEDLRLGRPVALKRFAGTGAPDTGERLRREARLLAGLAHPNLVAVFDAGLEAEDGGWIALELVPGPDLAALLRASGPPDSDDVRRIVGDVAAALAHIHARGIVHRDLKPANVLLTAPPGAAPWQAKLADFGIARLLEDERMTTTGTVVGTAAYLSPEQTRGDTVGTASDVYSLGLVALEVLTGQRPFPGTAVESATARLVRDPTVPPWLGEPWTTLLATMTAADPAARPSAAQVARAASVPFPVVDRPAVVAVVSPADVPTERATAVLAAAEPATAVLTPAGAAGAATGARRPGRRRTAVGGAVVAGVAALALSGALLGGVPKQGASPVATSSASSTVTPVKSVTPVRAAPSVRVTRTTPRVTAALVQPAKHAGKAKGHGNKSKGKGKGGGRGKHG